MKNFQSHFWYSKSQRNGILFLVGIIIITQLIYVYADFSEEETLLDTDEIDLYQKKIDSLKLIQSKNQSPQIFPFNPNYLTDFKAYQLGMNVYEIDNLLAYRKTGKFINSASEFQKITLISDSLLLEISPYFKFPDWVKKSKKENTKSTFENKQTLNIEKKDLNKATESDLRGILGIGEKLSKRIISYRNLLQGFSVNDQLYEVYFLDTLTANKVLHYFEVVQKPIIQKLNINDATFKEVLKLPYIEYDLTKKIINYRNSVNQINNLEELKKIDSFPLDKFDRIALYLLAE